MTITSCEKVIDLPIDDGGDVIVVEAIMKDRDTASYVNISNSVGIYDQPVFQKTSNASVIVTDEFGGKWIFDEDPLNPGTYLNSTFLTQANTTYYLEVKVGSTTITSSSYTKSPPVMDSIYTKPNFLDAGTPQSSWVYYHSTDNANEVNNYRLRIWIDGDEPSQYFLGNDYYINGETYEAQFFTADVYAGDSVFVEMLEFDENVYNYLYGLSNTLITGPFSPAPANPPSNLESDGAEVTGYFAAMMTDTLSLIVQ